MRSTFLSILFILAIAIDAHSQLKLDVEGGIVPGTAYNRIRIPNAGGTTVNLATDLQMKTQPFYRIRAGYLIKNRHNISALFAPLTLTYTGSVPNEIAFNGQKFPANDPLRVRYKFNSYRLTYRYDFLARVRWRVGVGITGKVRDAQVRFEDEATSTAFDNLGFVPLVNFYAQYRPTYRWSFLIEGDALASRQGRAEDIFGGVTYQMTPKLAAKLGYRFLEGGADNDRIYNFNWVNYGSAGLLFSL